MTFFLLLNNKSTYITKVDTRMNIQRISAMAGRYIKLGFGNFNQLINLAFWPILDVVIWGLNSIWVQGQGTDNVVGSIVITSIILWNCVGRGSVDFAYGMIDEVWPHNLMNLFASPLTTAEWLVSLAISTLIKIMFVVSLCSSLAYLLYGISIFKLGSFLLPFVFYLCLAGLTLGIISVGFLIYWGRRIDMIIWVMQWLFAPLCGVFYSVTVLPHWLQAVSRFIPMTFVFEGIRTLSKGASLTSQAFLYNGLLAIIYFLGALLFFKYMFEKSRKQGLGRL